jgi:RHS repeat-associated protein
LTEYGWDHRNRLTSVTFKTSGGTVTKAVQYEYDAYNRLVTKKLDSDANGTIDDTYHWIYDGNQAVLQFDGDTAADLSHRYLWGPAVDQLLADETVDSGGPEDILWPLTDWQGSVRHLAQYNASTDTTTVANEKFYDAYGNVTSESNSAVDTVFGWTGRMFDDDTGLQNNLNRWYDPVVGRFVSEDPIGFAAGGSEFVSVCGQLAGDVCGSGWEAPPRRSRRFRGGGVLFLAP